MDHYLYDLRSFDEHVHLVPRLRENPARLNELRRQWEYWLALPSCSCALEYSEAWLKAIDEGMDAVERLVLDESDVGQYLGTLPKKDGIICGGGARRKCPSMLKPENRNI